MWRYQQQSFFNVVPTIYIFLDLEEKLKALCGTMWRYQFLFFLSCWGSCPRRSPCSAEKSNVVRKTKTLISKPKPMNELIKQIQTQIVPPSSSESKTRRPFRSQAQSSQCGALWRLKNSCFWYWRKYILDFGGKNVALCSAMKNSCFLCFTKKVHFRFGEEIVALCGGVKNIFFLFLYQKSAFLIILEKKCGAV